MLAAVGALVIATLFSGAALYISLVEHPARLGLNDAALLGQWQPSYRRALPIQAGLALVGSMLGVIAWLSLEHWQWLAGAMLLLANWPFTMFAIMPTNKRLLAMSAGQAGPESRALLVRWGKLHSVRSGLGVISALLFACGLAAPHYGA